MLNRSLRELLAKYFPKIEIESQRASKGIPFRSKEKKIDSFFNDKKNEKKDKNGLKNDDDDNQSVEESFEYLTMANILEV
jgi:hypothetical protein